MKGWRYLPIILAIVALIVANVVIVTGQEPEPVEILELRDRNSKTFSLGGDKYALDVSIGSLHYKDDPDDPEELWKDIDTAITSSPRPEWEWGVVKGNWHLLINDDTTVALGKSGHWIGFRYMSFGYLDWSSKDYAILQHRQTVSPVIQDNRITWDGIFLGATLEYIYTPDGFKENLYVSQTTRDWLTANPPSSYGLDNSSSYLVGVLQCEWASSYQAETADGTPINWDNINEFVETGVFWRHPILDKIVTALPIGWAHHADDPESSVNIRYRFFSQDGTHYLLFGAKVLDLNAMPPGTIVIDPTVDEQVGSSSDDCYRRLTTSAWSTSSSYGFCGDLQPGATQDYSTGMRFTTVAVPQAATIDTAYITLKACGMTGSYVDSHINGEDIDDAATFSTDTDYDGRDRTSAHVLWTPTEWNDGTWYDSSDIKTIIQEIVDRGGWSSNNDLVIFWHDEIGFEEQDRHYIYSYDNASSDAPKLHVEYTAGAAAAGYSWGEIIG